MPAIIDIYPFLVHRLFILIIIVNGGGSRTIKISIIALPLSHLQPSVFG